MTKASAPHRPLVAAAVGLACGVLLVAALTPNLIFFENDILDLIVRKLGHLVAYSGIAFGTAIVLSARLRWPFAAGLVVLGATALAVLDEVLQMNVQGRMSSPLDVVLDVVGALGGILAWTWYDRRRIAR